MQKYIGNKIFADYNGHDVILIEALSNKRIYLPPHAILELKEFLNEVTSIPTNNKK